MWWLPALLLPCIVGRILLGRLSKVNRSEGLVWYQMLMGGLGANSWGLHNPADDLRVWVKAPMVKLDSSVGV